MEKYDNVKDILRYAMITVLILSATIYTGIFIGAEQIVKIFNSEQNIILQEIAESGLKYYFTAGAFAGGNIILAVYFTSTEYARPAHMISLLRGFIIVIPMAFLLSAMGGIVGVWCVFPVTEVLVFVIGCLLLRKRKKHSS